MGLRSPEKAAGSDQTISTNFTFVSHRDQARGGWEVIGAHPMAGTELPSAMRGALRGFILPLQRPWHSKPSGACVAND